jgi:hypothetical protein
VRTISEYSATAHPTRPPDSAGSLVIGRGRLAVGGFFLMTGGVHLGMVAADPTVYRHFADQALFGFVRDGWRDVFMAHATFWGLCLMALEVTLGVLLLAGPRTAAVGWAGVIAFHVLLMLFGFGFWVWSVPALALLVHLARTDRRLVGATATRAAS